MAATMVPLYCPQCGDADFYTSRPLEADISDGRWVLLPDGGVAVAHSADLGELTVVTTVEADVYCHHCHAAVTGRSLTRTKAPSRT